MYFTGSKEEKHPYLQICLRTNRTLQIQRPGECGNQVHGGHGCVRFCPAVGVALCRSCVCRNSIGETFVSSLEMTFLTVRIWLQCVLAAIIIVSLKGIFLQFTHLPHLFRRSLSDSIVWLLTFWATVMLDVHLGLIVGAVLNVFILLRVALNPIIDVTEETDFADLNLSPKYYQDVHAKEGFATLKLYGNLNFANAAKTQTAIEQTLKKLRSGCIGATKNIGDEEGGIPSPPRERQQQTSKFFLILDVSCLSGIDSSGCNTLVNIRNKLRKTGVHLALVGPSGE